MNILKPFLIIQILFAFNIAYAQTKSNDLPELVKSGKVEISAKAINSLRERNIEIKLSNKSSEKIKVQSKPGILMKSKDPGAQDLLIMSSIQIELEVNEMKELQVTGFCTQMHNYGPKNGDTYIFQGYANSALRELSEILKDVDEYSKVQHAVWIITDDYYGNILNTFSTNDSSNYIAYSKLSKFVFERKNAKLPYRFTDNTLEAYQGEVFSFKGVLSYQVPKGQIYTFQTVNEEGEIIHQYFKNRTLKPGLKFYTFGINQIVEKKDEAIFYTQLLDSKGNIVKKERVIESTILEQKPTNKKTGDISIDLKQDLVGAYLNVYKESGELLMEYRRFKKLSKGLYNMNLTVEYIGEEQENLKVVLEDRTGKEFYSKILK